MPASESVPPSQETTKNEAAPQYGLTPFRLFSVIALAAAAVGGFLLGRGPGTEVVYEAHRVSLPPDLAEGDPDFQSWVDLFSRDSQTFETAVEQIVDRNAPGTSAGLAEFLATMARWIPRHQRDTVSEALAITSGLSDQTSINNVFTNAIWSKPYQPFPRYAEFKAALYSQVDTRFREYFEKTDNAKIRLDEIRWGGVRRDGIPPLKDPEMVPAGSPGSEYLDPTDVVFGVTLDGESKCYPKRILAWHEMVKDTVGDTSICGVYCTLCGSMIVYRSEFGGQHFELGTSGFLYRSNKLMYDHGTKSLWSTLDGKPVVGPLVGETVGGRPIELEREAVVTTTWGEWLERHPDTKVLTLNTGHSRDYREGAAYRDYFATDKLMFSVPKTDDQLPNKLQVVGLRFDDVPGERLAVTTTFLNENPVYEDAIGPHEFVVLTDESGANRVYETLQGGFASYDGQNSAKSKDGRVWTLTEDALVSGEDRLNRLPAHRAFWFGWYSANPDTRLVK